jgi:hypothetical protein
MGGSVGWDDGTQKITLSANGHNVEMWLNKKDLYVDGVQKEMDVAPVTINDRTMVPVRFAAENVGCVVDWISSTNEIVIVYFSGGSTPTAPPSQPVPAPTPTPQPTPTSQPTLTPTPTPTPQPPMSSGNIDTALVGVWSYDSLTLHDTERHKYFFYEDGTAELFITGSWFFSGDATYSISYGKIYFSPYYSTDQQGIRSLRPDKTVEYTIGTDERGEYLTIGNVSGWTDYSENAPGRKFRRE